MRVFLIVVALLFATVPAFAQSSSRFAPSSVTHALYLQTTGMLAQMAVVEPCTSDGLSDAVRRSDAAYENQDVMTLQTEQNGYAVGFARCALQATSPADFATFACATVQSATSVIDAHHAVEGTQPSDHVKAQQLLVIGRWLLHDSHAQPICRQIINTSVAKLRRFHAL